MANKKESTAAADNSEELDENVSIGELVKKLVSAGIGAAFMTEEGVRSYLGGIKLPKEMLHLILQGANKSKEDMLNVVSNEVIKIVNRIDFVKEASRFVEEHKFKINAEIEVVRKDRS